MTPRDVHGGEVAQRYAQGQAGPGRWAVREAEPPPWAMEWEVFPVGSSPGAHAAPGSGGGEERLGVPIAGGWEVTGRGTATLQGG